MSGTTISPEEWCEQILQNRLAFYRADGNNQDMFTLAMFRLGFEEGWAQAMRQQKKDQRKPNVQL